jgi:hypothetical protein
LAWWWHLVRRGAVARIKLRERRWSVTSVVGGFGVPVFQTTFAWSVSTKADNGTPGSYSGASHSGSTDRATRGPVLSSPSHSWTLFERT